jgi:subtilisin family serine protease
VVLAGDVKDPDKDDLGHGTGQSANLFSLAPKAEFIGVKIGGKDLSGIFDINPASMLEGFYKACEQNPDIISVSGGFDLRLEGKQRSPLPNSLKALEGEILHAIASGITVVVAAGNGYFSFPAMMPDVIAVGGVFVDKNGKKCASNIASAYRSEIYNRHVPDFCGLVGRQEDEDRYIMLPIPPACILDLVSSADPKSGTKRNDGWAAFSGTSAAAPQIAGVCALLKEKNPDLKPLEIKDVLRRTARKVLDGNSNPKSSDDGKTPQRAGPGNYGATGAGLVDAFSAWQQV